MLAHVPGVQIFTSLTHQHNPICLFSITWVYWPGKSKAFLARGGVQCILTIPYVYLSRRISSPHFVQSDGRCHNWFGTFSMTLLSLIWVGSCYFFFIIIIQGKLYSLMPLKKISLFLFFLRCKVSLVLYRESERYDWEKMYRFSYIYKPKLKAFFQFIAEDKTKIAKVRFNVKSLPAFFQKNVCK